MQPRSGRSSIDPSPRPRLHHTLTAPVRSPTPDAFAESGPLTPGRAFGLRYHIIRVLGVGGMGAVYQAWDAELGVAVAIKVIRPEVMADPGGREMERRFKHELVLARQVTHKNVVRIHDLGEIDGIKYITMPYLDGIDLATMLKQRGQARRDGAEYRTVASSGLVAAHEAGVVHRDLKPANIMIVRRRGADHGLRDRAVERDPERPRPSRRRCPRTCSLPRRAYSPVTDDGPSSAPSSTWRPSRPKAKPSISAPISTRSA